MGYSEQRQYVAFVSEKLYEFIISSDFDKRIMSYISEFRENNNNSSWP